MDLNVVPLDGTQSLQVSAFFPVFPLKHQSNVRLRGPHLWAELALVLNEPGASDGVCNQRRHGRPLRGLDSSLRSSPMLRAL